MPLAAAATFGSGARGEHPNGEYGDYYQSFSDRRTRRYVLSKYST
jgi:hypothetical protein